MRYENTWRLRVQRDGQTEDSAFVETRSVKETCFKRQRREIKNNKVWFYPEESRVGRPRAVSRFCFCSFPLLQIKLRPLCRARPAYCFRLFLQTSKNRFGFFFKVLFAHLQNVKTMDSVIVCADASQRYKNYKFSGLITDIFPAILWSFLHPSLLFLHVKHRINPVKPSSGFDSLDTKRLP